MLGVLVDGELKKKCRMANSDIFEIFKIKHPLEDGSKIQGF
jgi:hypothetical protein